MKWMKRYMTMAQLVASWSKDDIGVGAVIYDLRTNRMVSFGFNGVARGVDESFVAFRTAKLHAEQNAILFAQNVSLGECGIVVWPFMPCGICAAMIIQVGIKKVIIPEDSLFSEKWQREWDLAAAQFDSAGVEVVKI